MSKVIRRKEGRKEERKEGRKEERKERRREEILFSSEVVKSISFLV